MNTNEKFEKLKKLADNMYVAAQYLSTDALQLKKAMNEYHHFVVYELNKIILNNNLLNNL